MKRHPLYVVDAFSGQPFHGNPAAVCLLRHPHPDHVLQSVAAEMNLSETAFVSAPNGDLFASQSFDLRWFTPTMEVSLCGHATLACAKVLFDELGLSDGAVTFHTKSGALTASPVEGGIELDFPRNDATPSVLPRGLDQILGPDPVEEVRVVETRGLVLVKYASPEIVRRLRPDFGRLRRDLPDVHMVIATAPGDPPYDFTSRCFAPNDGIDEDPVTGLAHTVLGPYWAEPLGKDNFEAYQASPRGGSMRVTLRGSDRVLLRGRARIVVRGYLDLPE